ncbi:MAG: Ppx/GppA family phosphatase [Thermoanaerobacteraceae bacterium]
MKISAIDIGTNSIRQLICRINDDKTLIKLRKEAHITRLGEGISKTEKLSTNAINRSIEVIDKYITDAKDENVEVIYAFATSAVRDAKNKEALFTQIKSKGIDIDVIDGDKESLYGYIGAIKGVNKNNALVLDIGGGSTEIAYKTDFFVKESFDIGSVRLTEDFIKNDPPISDEYDEIRLHIIDMLINSIDQYATAENIIGIGGTITTISAISQGLVIYDPDKVHGYELKRDEIKRVLDYLMSVNLEERKRIPGLQPERADIIIAGTIILLTILEMLNLKSITVSEWDNLEGSVIYNFVGEDA